MKTIKMTKFMGKVLLLTLVFSAFALPQDVAQAAASAQFMKMLGRVWNGGGDVAKTMKDVGKSVKVLSNTEKADILKRFPKLANKSDDIVRATAAVVKFSEKGPGAERLVTSLKSPVIVLRMNAKNPHAWEIVHSGAEGLEKLPAIPTEIATAIARTPKGTSSMNSIRGLLGNYEKTTNLFVDKLALGGKNVMEYSQKLLVIAKDNPKTAAALSLLAWHMIDPEGSEESIDNFFKDHVAPLTESVTKGAVEHGVVPLLEKTFEHGAKPLADATTKVAEETVNSLLRNIFKSPTTMGIFFVILIFVIPGARRTALLLLSWPFNSLNSKIEKKMREGNTASTPTDAERAERAKFQASLRGGKR